MCAFGPQSGRPNAEKVCFYDEMPCEWDITSSCEVIFSLGVSMSMWVRFNVLRVLRVCMWGIK